MVPFLPKGFDGSTRGYSHCDRCGLTTENYNCKTVIKGSPLGKMGANAINNSSEYTVVEHRRRLVRQHKEKRTLSDNNRKFNRDATFEATEDPAPLLAGKPDKDLEALLDKGILVYYQDSVPGEDIEQNE